MRERKNLDQCQKKTCLSYFLLSFLRLQGNWYSQYRPHFSVTTAMHLRETNLSNSKHAETTLRQHHVIFELECPRRNSHKRRKSISERHCTMASCACSGIRANSPQWQKHLNKHLAHCAVTDIKTAPGEMIQLGVIFPGGGFLSCEFLH